jgi:hypothetical protein
MVFAIVKFSRQTEIANLHSNVCLACALEQNVLSFDVSVDNSFGMHMVDCRK